MEQETCFMCGELLTAENATKEHVFPKWLLTKFNLYDECIVLLNGRKLQYRSLTVPCCRKCNGGKMSEFESEIKNALTGGSSSMITLDKRILVWWLAKIYYAVLLKETTLDSDRSKKDSKKIVSKEGLTIYSLIRYLMRAIINEESFIKDPFEIFVFKSESSGFDYQDFIAENVVYIQLGDIICICSFDSQGECGQAFQKDINYLNSKIMVKPAQAYELFVKFFWFKSLFSYSYDLAKIDKENVLRINFTQERPFNVDAFNQMILKIWDEKFNIGISRAIPAGKMITLLNDDAFKTDQ